MFYPQIGMGLPCPRECGEKVWVEAPESASRNYTFDWWRASVECPSGCCLTEDEMDDLRVEAERQAYNGRACSAGAEWR